MAEEPTTPNAEPTITLPLREFLTILWGFKWKGELADYRERAYPSDAVILALEQQIPAEVAARYFKIVRPRPSVDAVVWEIGEWRKSGAREQETREASSKFNFASDTLTEWLIANVGFMKLQERSFVRQIAFTVVSEGNYDCLRSFGLTEEMITKIKEGKYE